MNHSPQQGSALSRTVSAFAHTASALGVFLLIPWLEQNIRPAIYAYFHQTFPQDISVWSSWAFLVVLVLCAFFGVSAAFQLGVQLVLRRSARRSVF
jgi:UPF0716 family protein affecting phage T7 exclusion